MADRISHASERLNRSESDVIRDCIDIGLRHLAAINFDVAGAILAHVARAGEKTGAANARADEIDPEFKKAAGARR